MNRADIRRFMQHMRVI